MLKIKECKKFMKVCKCCQRLKMTSCFSKRKDSKDGYRNKCRQCVKDKGIYSFKCKQCGKEVKTNVKTSKFCSQDCLNKWKSDNIKGKNHHNYNRVKCKCDYCKKEIELKRSIHNKSEHHFCSKECQGKWNSIHRIGENNPNYGNGDKIRGDKNYSWKGGDVYYKCEQCGKEHHTNKASYEFYTHHFCSKECFHEWQRETEIWKGEKSPRWRYDLTKEEREKGRNLEGYSEWRLQVYERDNYTCQCCGDSKGHNLNAHHLNGYNWDKKHRTDINNGVTLCEKCHKKFHKIYGNKNNTKEQFINFIENTI